MDADRNRSHQRVNRSLLHRPSQSKTLHRSRLTDELDRGVGSALTLVSAPAGFGKTSLVSDWCGLLDRPVAWLSLNSSVDDPASFLDHLGAAIRTVAPAALVRTTDMATAAVLPSEDALVRELGLELSSLPTGLVVVLDDYHNITDPVIDRLVTCLVGDSAAAVQLVLVSRTTPRLRISALRADGALTELRMTALAFTEAEIGQLAEIEFGSGADLETTEALASDSEGWAVGVRLAIEAARHRGSRVASVGLFDKSAQDYISAEILDGLPASVRRFLVSVSHLDSFSAALCDALAAEAGTDANVMSGAEFVAWLLDRNLFVIPVDDESRWLRFHDVFVRMLRDWVGAQLTQPVPDARDVHRVASLVYEQEGMLDQAFDSAVRAGNDSNTARLAAAMGEQMADQGDLSALSRLMARVPAGVIESDPTLVVLCAWASQFGSGRTGESEVALSTADAGSLSTATHGTLIFLRSHREFTSGNMDAAVDGSEKALRLLDATVGNRQILAVVQLVAALTASGRIEEAQAVALARASDPRMRERGIDPSALALAALCWRKCDISGLSRHGRELLELGKRSGVDSTTIDGLYCMGIASYEANLLVDAEQYLEELVERRFSAPALNAAHALVALALTRLARGDVGGADAAAQMLHEFMSDTHSQRLMPISDGLQAQIRISRGETASAARWARRAVFEPSRIQYLFFNPTLVQVGALLALPEDADRGRRLLADYLRAAEQQHHRPLIIRLLGLRAIDHRARGENAEALESARRAVTMAGQGGALRLLADLGPNLAEVLLDLQAVGSAADHAAKVLEAMGEAARLPAPTRVRVRDGAEVIDLTDREREVLALLADRSTNKEIAARLSIAPATVKKHTVTLYQKLHVGGRREATEAARTLGYLAD